MNKNEKAGHKASIWIDPASSLNSDPNSVPDSNLKLRQQTSTLKPIGANPKTSYYRRRSL